MKIKIDLQLDDSYLDEIMKNHETIDLGNIFKDQKALIKAINIKQEREAIWGNDSRPILYLTQEKVCEIELIHIK